MRRNQTLFFRAGLTLVELVAVIGCLSLVIALSLVGMSAAREASRRTQCQTKLRDMGLAVASFETTSGALPVGFGRPVSSRNAIQNSQHSFFVDILPQLEFQATYDKIMSQHDGFYFVDILYPELAKGFGDYFRCPSEVEDTACNYRGNGGTSMYPFSMEVFGLNEGGNGAFKERESLRSSDFADGTE